MDKHYTVMVLLMTDETPRRALLVENRKHQRWMPPGGHQEAGENPLQAAIREVKEETGLDVADCLPEPQRVDDSASVIPLPARLVEVRIPQRGTEPAHYHLDMLYVAHVPRPLEITKNDRELAAAKWLTLDETEDVFVPADIRLILGQEMAR